MDVDEEHRFLVLPEVHEVEAPHGLDRGLSGPEPDLSVQEDTKAHDDHDDGRQQWQVRFRVGQPHLIEDGSQDQHEDAEEREDREDDPHGPVA